MSKKKLLINLPPGFFKSELLRERFEKIEAKYEVRKTSCNTNEEIAEHLSWPDAIIMWAWPSLTKKDFDSAVNLKMLAQINTTRGMAEEALARGIALSEVRSAWSPAVAEMALTLILTGLRRVSEFHMKMRLGTDDDLWERQFPFDVSPLERQLTGRTVGIVGFGGIGQQLARFLAPFNVTLWVNDPFLPQSIFDQFNAKNTTVDDICANCEIVVLCAANSSGAAKVVSAKHINSFKKDSVLVNVGRSMLIDMGALAERLLKNDMIAMIDVHDHEPLEKNSVFRKMPNAFLSPHRAGGIYESVYRSMDWLIDDIDAFFAGEKRKYIVTENMAQCFPG